MNADADASEECTDGRKKHGKWEDVEEVHEEEDQEKKKKKVHEEVEEEEKAEVGGVSIKLTSSQ